jgi:hypothetical protein
MSPSDIMRRILCVLPIDKYGHIIIVLHQGDLSAATPTQILGKINAHEMHITPQDGSSSTKKKDLAFKASQEKKGKAKAMVVSHDTSSDDDLGDLALMVKKTTKMLKRLNKNGVKFDSKKKKFFTSSKRKPLSKMDCYNCGDLGHLAHQCSKPPKKDKYKKKHKDKKDDSCDDGEKKKEKPYKKKDGKKKEYHKKNGKAYIVGDWLTDIDSSSGSSGEESDDEKEKVATLVTGSALPPPPSSSSTHLCLMSKGDRKVQSDDESSDNASGSDSDGEVEAPTYDELVKLLNKYSKIILKD